MTDFVDLFSGVQIGVTARMSGSAVPLFTGVPQNTQPPYHKLAEIDADSIAPDGQGQFETVQFEIHTVYRGTTRVDMHAAMYALRQQLDGQPLVAPGVLFGPVRYVRSAVSPAGPDGVTYVGLSVFETIGQPA